ncbi:hypothetical protein [Xylella fastidiosa]|uniref:hypothetical protein n=1 Tax=Xylella fastidiosa TaxID=2371 RepID=UPI002B4B8A69|nr:hypothetical protein [Xylella fastidiosa]
MRLKQPPRPAPRAAGPVKLQRPAQATVRAGAVQQRLVLSGAGAAGLSANRQQFAHRLWECRIVNAPRDRVLLHVRQRHAVRGAQVVQQCIALRRGLHRAAGQRLGTLG